MIVSELHFLMEFCKHVQLHRQCLLSFFGVYVTSFRRSAAAEVSVAAVLLIKLSSYTLNSSVICGSLNDAIYCKMAGLMTISDLEMAWNPAIVP